MAFPVSHRNNLPEWLHKEVKHHADLVGIFPSQASILGLIGALLLEADDTWRLQHRSMGIKSMADLLNLPQTNEELQIPRKRKQPDVIAEFPS